MTGRKHAHRRMWSGCVVAGRLAVCCGAALLAVSVVPPALAGGGSDHDPVGDPVPGAVELAIPPNRGDSD
jgi:hypothetical protein